MFKNFFPNKVLSINNNFINNLIILMILIIFLGLIYALFISPEDYIQGDSVRIMYVHVPSSFIALGCFALIGIASILNLIFKIKFMPLIAKSLAPIGIIFYTNFNCDWFIMGETYLGNMVGVGRKINIYAHLIFFLFSLCFCLEIYKKL